MAEAHQKSGFSRRRGSGGEERQWRRGPEVNATGGLVGKLHGAGRTRPEVGRRCGGTLAAKKTARAVRHSGPQLDTPDGAEAGLGQCSSVAARWSWWPRLEVAAR
jgi:hypothetical protein